MKFRIILLSAALACGFLTITSTAPAQGKGKQAVQAESFNAKFALAATPDAPAGAKGSALLNSSNHDGNQNTKLLLSTHGLDPGDYVVTGVQTSDGAEVTLDQITVPESRRGHHKTDTKDKMTVADVDGAGIGEIVVSDTNGVAMLQGDLESPGSSGNLTAIVPVTGGEVAPDATGSAKLKVNVRNGHRKDNFAMRASGVPPNSTFTVTVDDTDAGTVKSSRDGRVAVTKIPEGLGSISAVVLTDESGGEVVRADF